MDFRAQVGDPRRFVGKRIAKKCLFNQWKRGLVIRILNMEGINTIFQVQWEDGSHETPRLIEDYLKSEVWLEEDQSDVAQHLAHILLGKLSKIREKRQQMPETVKIKEVKSQETEYIP